MEENGVTVDVVMTPSGRLPGVDCGVHSCKASGLAIEHSGPLPPALYRALYHPGKEQRSNGNCR